MSWECRTCGKIHEGTPNSYAFSKPWPWYTYPKEERQTRWSLDENYGVLDNESFFIRGCIEMPIIGEAKPFLWGVWTSLSETNFKRAQELQRNLDRVKESPYFGWLASRIPIYPDVLLLKIRVHTREVGTRPYIELQPTDHPLAVEQRNGITVDRVQEIAELMEHKWQHPEWMSGKNRAEVVKRCTTKARNGMA